MAIFNYDLFKVSDSSVKWSNPGNFLKARFVIFRCQKICKKGHIEMTNKNYLETLKSVLGCSILHYCRTLEKPQERDPSEIIRKPEKRELRP